jgi:hypothetical protein
MWDWRRAARRSRLREKPWTFFAASGSLALAGCAYGYRLSAAALPDGAIILDSDKENIGVLRR